MDTKKPTFVENKEIQANPKGAVAIGGAAGDPAGYRIQGEIRIEQDPAGKLMPSIVCRYFPDEAGVNAILARVEHEERVIFRLTPTKVIRTQ